MEAEKGRAFHITTPSRSQYYKAVTEADIS